MFFLMLHGVLKYVAPFQASIDSPYWQDDSHSKTKPYDFATLYFTGVCGLFLNVCLDIQRESNSTLIMESTQATCCQPFVL